MKTKIFVIMLIFVSVLISFQNNAFASKTLEWNQNDSADYYIVYWGKISGEYTTGNSDKILVPITTFTYQGIDENELYFAVKAFNSCGNASDFSDELTPCQKVDKTINLKYKDNANIVININQQ